MTEEQVFLAALDLPDAAARAAYLDEACGTNAALRQQVEALLASHFQSGEFLDVPAAEQIGTDSNLGDAVTIQSNTMAADRNHDDESDALEFLAPPTRPDSLGRIDHYEVLQVLGKGGFGIVFRAFDDVLQRVVAIKVMAPQMAATSPARKRFLREARTSAQVRHENVVQVYEVGEQPLPYLVMEFIPGETLQQRIDRMGPLDVSETLRIGKQIAEGLAAAHAMDLIHRDIKPGNVLLEGGQHKVKITDFGLARAADDASMTQSGQIAGTPMYMAPEQALGETLDQRADLFSLGSVLYQMVAGRPPFRANTAVAVLKRVVDDTPRNIREVIPETPQWLCDIIAKLHAKKPADRYQSAREVADVLADCEEQLKQSSRLRDFSRIPRNTSLLGQRSVSWKWIATAAALMLPVLALTVAEFAGVTNFFQAEAPVAEPIEHAIVTTPVVAAPATDGFVALFNGKDLTGWKTHPEAPPGHWEVKEGVLIGSQGQGFLYSERADFANFHLRVQAKVNLGGDSGVLFRLGSEVPPGGGYEAEIQKNRAYARKTGTIDVFQPNGPPLILGLVDDDSLTRPDEWFELEIIAQEGHFITKINGLEAANCSDPANPNAAGHIVLQVWSADTVVQFRKIEIKELPASPPVSDGFVQLFNGKDLTGWKYHPDHSGHWEVKDGILRGTKRQSHLFSERGDYQNFHLRAEVKINLGGDSGILFRAPLELVRGRSPFDFGIPGCYEAELQHNRTHLRPTGSILVTSGDAAPTTLGRVLDTSLTEPDEWFTYEVIAEGNHFITKINGSEAANCDDPQSRHPTGHIALQVWHANTLVQFRKIEIKELPATLPASDGFVQLFNGKDLTGWQPGQKSVTRWRVENGVLTGSDGTGHLFSERKYHDFHLRVESRINPTGNSGISFRGEWQAEINNKPVSRTGSLLHIVPSKAVSVTSYAHSIVVPNTWFTMEVRAEGPSVAIRVNNDPWMTVSVAEGDRIAQNLHLETGADTVAEFRKIEIKELPASPPVIDGFVQLFNGKDLTGWKTHSLSGGDWRVEDGAIDGRGTTSYLFSESGDYDNFHLRVEAKINGNGDAGVCFRTPFDVKGLGQTGPAKFALLEGYEAAIAARPNWANHTGSLTTADGTVLQAGPLLPHKADEWFVLEVIAEDNRIRTLVDGKPMADYLDEDAQSSRGHIALQTWGPNITSVQFRKIEIKELPASAPLATAPAVSVQTLRELVAAKESERDLAKQSALDGKLSKLELIYAEIDALEARVQLTLAEGNGAAHIAAFRSLVAFREQERELVAQQVQAGQLTADDLERADSSLVDARGRLAKALAEAPAAAPFTDADVRRIAALPAEQQVAAVVASLKQRNPGLNGTASHKIVDGVVTEFNFNPTDDQNALTDLSPVRALAGLTSLNLWNCSALADLSPLQGLPLTKLLIGSLDVSNEVRDLKPLQGMKLTELHLYQCQVEDLKPLAGMPLIRLRVFSRQVRDCAPLQGMPLTMLDLSYCTQIQDFTPLTGLPLTGLHLNGCQIRDLQPLLGLKLTEVSLAGTRVQDLQQLKGMPLKNLAIHRTGVTDLTPLQGMELKEIFLTPKTITQGLNHLRDMQSLSTIGIGYASTEKWPAAEFWERHEKGEFK